ncbi:MAG: PAS domain S-box protein [Methanomicrobiales archaeon]|nr:PAS domain S-box protein [Methanomicrobiales archaeon]
MISILYVDDDRSLLEIGKLFLERTADFQVELADSADMGLTLLSHDHFDVIISDYEMPKKNGLEFLQEVRSQYGEIPFILFTGRGREEVVILALNYGADFYLQKGGEPKSQFAELAHKVRTAFHKRKADMALEESERKYRDIVETQRDFICRFTPDGITVFANEAYCTYFDVKTEDILGTSFKPKIHPEDISRLLLHFQSLTPDHPMGDIEHRIIMPDGSIRWHWWREHAFFDEQGRVFEYQSVGRDITEQKRAENILLTQLELGLISQKTTGLYELLELCLTKAIEISELDSGGIYLVDEKTGSIDLALSHNLSDEFIAQVPSFSPDSIHAEVIRKGAPIFTNYNDLDKNQNEEIKRDGLQAIAIIPIFSANELVACLNISSHSIIKISESSRVALETIATQIGAAIARVKAEEALLQSEERYRSVINEQTELIARFTPNGTITFSNKSFRSFYEKISENKDIQAKKIFEIIRFDDNLQNTEIFQSISPENPIYESEGMNYINSGKKIWHHWTIRAILDENQHITEYQLVGRDITETKNAEEALKEEQHKFETVGKNIPGAIYQMELHPDGRILMPFVSKSWIDLTGIPDKEAIESPSSIFSVVLPEDREELFKSITESARTLTPLKHEFRTSFHDKVRWIYGSSIPEVQGPDGTIIWNGVLIDITERKNVEDELKRSENLYHAIFDNTGTATIIIEQDTTILYANAGFSRLSGFTIEELEHKKSWTEFIVKEDLERMKKYHADRRDDPSDAPRVYEFRFINKFGNIRFCMNNVSMIPGTTWSIASVQDITERVTAEMDYRSIFENIQDVFYRTDKSGNIILLSPSASKVLGYDSISGIIGQNVAQSFYSNPEVRDHFLEEIEKTGSVSNVEVLLKKKDGTPITVITSSHQYYDLQGEFKGIEGIFRDITDRKNAEDEYKKSENLYHAIFDNTGTATIIIEQDTTILYANDGFSRLSGFSIEELEHKKSWTEFIVKEDLERMKKYHADRRDDPSDAPRVYEFRFIDKFGNIRFCMNNVSMIPGTTWSIASVLDITDRVMAEMDYRTIFENIQDVFYRTDKSGNIIQLSPSASKVLGYDSISGIIGQNVAQSFYSNPEVRDQFLKEIEKTGSVSNVEVLLKKKDGTPITVITSSHKYYDLQGEFKGIEGIFRDITERKKAEDELLASERKYRSIIENMQDLLYQVDLDGNLTMISPMGALIAGYSSPEEMIGLNIRDTLFADLVEREELIRILTENGTIKDFPLTLSDRNGNILYVTASCHYFYDNQGNCAGIEGIMHDITRLKLAEESLRQANKKLNLLTDITRHDINNQLIGLMGFLQILDESVQGSSLQEMTGKAITISDHINSIIQFTKQYEEIGINIPTWQNVRQTVDQAALQLNLNSVTLKNELPEKLEIYADPMFFKIVYNLIENALRYGEKITTIRFHALQKDEDFLIICEDDGTGIPDDMKEKIFERGFGKNTGLGLTLCREIFSITGITIQETGQTEIGAMFEINVPKRKWRYAD